MNKRVVIAIKCAFSANKCVGWKLKLPTNMTT